MIENSIWAIPFIRACRNMLGNCGGICWGTVVKYVRGRGRWGGGVMRRMGQKYPDTEPVRVGSQGFCKGWKNLNFKFHLPALGVDHGSLRPQTRKLTITPAMCGAVRRCLMMFHTVWWTLKQRYVPCITCCYSFWWVHCLSDAWVMLEWFLSDAKRVMRAQRRDLQASGSFRSVWPAGAGNWSLASAAAVRETDHYTTSDV